MKKIILLFTVLVFCCLQICCAQKAGSLHLPFGGKGWATEDFIKTNYYDEGILQIFPAANNSYVAVLTGRALVRFLPDGRIDSSFGKEGYAFTNENIQKAVQQPDGKILIASSAYDNTVIPGVPGYFIYYLIRYNADGNVDSSFGNNGKVFNDFKIRSLVVQSDGKIFVAGIQDDYYPEYYFAIARYNSDGTKGTSLDGDGKLTNDSLGGKVAVSSAVVQSDGKIIVSGTILVDHDCDKCDPSDELALVRYNSDGSLDHSFGDNGKVFVDFGFDKRSYMAIDMLITLYNDKIILTTSISDQHNSDIAVTRYNSDGSPDVGFNISGPHPADFGLEDVPSSLTTESDGKILVTVQTSDLFHQDVGDFALVRYNLDGTLDNTFNEDGKLITDFGFNDYANCILTQNGKILVAGGILNRDNRDYALARYNNDGSLDNGFSGDGKEVGYIHAGVGELNSLAIQNDGKIVVAGSVVDSIRRSNFFVSRYNLDGSIDSTFSEDGKQVVDFRSGHSHVFSLAIQKDGKIVLGGDNENRLALVRLNTTGEFDSTFSGDGKQITNLEDKYSQARIASLAMQNDGKIIAAGYASESRIAIALYNPNGSLDNTFSDDGKLLTDFHGIAESVAVQNDGKIVVAGGNLLSRFTADGNLDLSFSDDGRQTAGIYGNVVTIQNDGKILVGGQISDGDLAVARFNSDGSIDQNFNKTGIFSAHIGKSSFVFNINVQIDGKIILTSGSFNSDFQGDVLIIRLNTEGSYDENFGSHGQVIKDFGGDERGFSSAINNNTLYVAGNKIISAYNLNDNIFPAVRITHPVDRSRHTAPAYIELSADAMDADGTIQKVDFYNGSNLIFTEDVAPYQRKGYVIPEPGTYSLTAKATDNDGNVTTSDAVNITVVPNKPPTVKITHPLNRTRHFAPAYIELSADATDADGTIQKVDFYNGSDLIFSEDDTPYKRKGYVLTEPGNYALTARATDNDGNVSTSDVVNITVILNRQKPTFGFTLSVLVPVPHTLSLGNVNNGTVDANESASLIGCVDFGYRASGYFHSSPDNLYNITVTSKGNPLIFDHHQRKNRVLTAAQLSHCRSSFNRET
jgi:uncharacterized delta-60 repeat protein